MKRPINAGEMAKILRRHLRTVLEPEGGHFEEDEKLVVMLEWANSKGLTEVLSIVKSLAKGFTPWNNGSVLSQDLAFNCEWGMTDQRVFEAIDRLYPRE